MRRESKFTGRVSNRGVGFGSRVAHASDANWVTSDPVRARALRPAMSSSAVTGRLTSVA